MLWWIILGILLLTIAIIAWSVFTLRQVTKPFVDLAKQTEPINPMENPTNFPVEEKTEGVNDNPLKESFGPINPKKSFIDYNAPSKQEGIAEFGLLHSKCSKSCCSPQYPVPHVKQEPIPEGFVHSSYKCNNSWEDAGCLCMTTDQHELLSNRGGNA